MKNLLTAVRTEHNAVIAMKDKMYDKMYYDYDRDMKKYSAKLADARKEISDLKKNCIVKRRNLTTEQKSTYYIIVKTAHGFGVKRNQIITFALGIMNTMFPDINEADSFELCNGVQDRFDAIY